jgi:hypothetical protein
MRFAHRLLLGIAAAALVVTGASRAGHVQTPPGFASRIAQLSEPGGFFDTDNLISNEKSYLHVIPALRESGLSGGVYLGVGPDQNFSYIAQLKPSMAIIVDIRRDNLLLHLLFKAIFQLADTRIGYLSLLFGHPIPGDLADWRNADVEKLLAHVDVAPPSGPSVAALRARVSTVIRGFGVPLSPEDLSTIDRFHRTFINAGPALKFESTGRAPRPYYPSYKDLLLETDRAGHHWSFLASEEDYQFLRSLEQRDLVIPIVGNLAGPTALKAVGKLMTERGDQLSAFYTSNVEFYLFSDGTFPKFVDNLSRLPHTNRSLIIRSIFANGFSNTRFAPGYGSASIVANVDDLLQGSSAGRIRDYRELTTSR